MRSAPAAAVLRGGAFRAPILGGRVRRFVSHTALCPLSCVGSCVAGRAGRTGTVGMERGASGRSQPTAPSGPALRALRWPGKGPVWPPRPQPAVVDSGPVAVATGGDSARRSFTMGSVGDRAEHAATTHGQRRADHGRAPRPPVRPRSVAARPALKNSKWPNAAKLLRCAHLQREKLFLRPL